MQQVLNNAASSILPHIQPLLRFLCRSSLRTNLCSLDLLFFNRLTAAKLPEETYHSWSYTPARQHSIVLTPPRHASSSKSPTSTTVSLSSKLSPPRLFSPPYPSESGLPHPEDTIVPQPERNLPPSSDSVPGTQSVQRPALPTPTSNPPSAATAASLDQAKAKGTKLSKPVSSVHTSPSATDSEAVLEGTSHSIPQDLTEQNPIIGFINTTFETTKKVLAARRLALLQNLVSNTALTRTTGASLLIHCAPTPLALSLPTLTHPLSPLCS
jgi:hypothetical protein